MPGPIDISNFAKSSPELVEDLDHRRSSACSTLHQYLCDSSLGVSLTSGSGYGGLAYSKVAQTYSKIRFCTGSTAPAALTSVVLGVTDASGNVLATTADQSSAIGTSASTLFNNIALVAPVTLGQDQPVYLAIAWAGTTLNVLGLPGRTSGLMSLPELTRTLTRAASSYTTGALPTLTSAGGVASVPWIELIP